MTPENINNIILITGILGFMYIIYLCIKVCLEYVIQHNHNNK